MGSPAICARGLPAIFLVVAKLPLVAANLAVLALGGALGLRFVALIVAKLAFVLRNLCPVAGGGGAVAGSLVTAELALVLAQLPLVVMDFGLLASRFGLGGPLVLLIVAKLGPVATDLSMFLGHRR